MCSKRFGLIVLLISVGLGNAWAAISPGQKIGIDFGPTATDNWNNITGNGVTAEGTVVATSGAVLDGINITVADGRFFNNDGADNWLGLASNGGTAPSEFLDSVTTDIAGSFGRPDPFVITVAGLNDGLVYDVVAVCTSIPPYANEETLTINDGVSQSVTRSDTRDNGMFHSFTEVSTDGNGNLVLSFTNSPQNNPIVCGILITTVGVGQASGPAPGMAVEDVARDTSLSWEPGLYAVTHDVYFGTSMEAVRDADRDNPMGVLLSEDQADSTFDPGRLDFGTTYYWRVDEVNTVPSLTVYKGDVWNFTAEQLAYPVQGVTAAASSVHLPDMGPEKTVDGSGFNDADQHGILGTDMWLPSNTDTERWIQYSFTKAQKLHSMWVWNHNQGIESLVGFGAKEVTIETSMDGTTWTALADVPEFAQAPGAPDYAHSTEVNFNGVTAQHVRLTLLTGWGALPQSGLSEVRFLAIPVSPTQPVPIDGAAIEGVDVTLQWRAGREAASHDVILSSDLSVLEDGAIVYGSTQTTSYAVNGLNYNTTYYWRVVEVNEAETPPRHAGDIWQFTTPAYKVIDDFELYADEEFLEIWAFWADGYQNDDNGAIVGNGNIGERTIVHGGGQSMPITYDNSAAAVSEVTMQVSAQDWTASGLKSLALYFFGTVGNSGQLYLKINDTEVLYNGDVGDIARPVWQAWIVDLSLVGSVAQNVQTLSFGVKDVGATGKLYVDDVRLYPRTPEFVTPAAPDDSALVAHYALNGDAADSAGNANGTENGFPVYADGVEGQAMQFDGIDDFIDLGVPEHWPAGADARSMCAWAKSFSVGPGFRVITGYGTPAGAQATGFAMNGTTLYGFGYGSDVNTRNFWDTEEWHHVGLTYDGTVLRLYADGVEAVSAERAWNTVISVARIGRQVNEGPEFWDGLIDDVRLYDQALSRAEMAWLAGKTAPVVELF